MVADHDIFRRRKVTEAKSEERLICAEIFKKEPESKIFEIIFNDREILKIEIELKFSPSLSIFSCK